MSITATAAGRAAVADQEAKAMIRALAQTLLAAARDEDTLSVPRFGSFAAQAEEEHIETDRATGRRMLMPPAIRLQFTPGGALRAAVAKHHKSSRGGQPS